MLILQERETCPHFSSCQYSNDCQGTNPNRVSTFTCSYVSNNGIIESGKSRSLYDQTGKMEILTENL
ncbi:MAG: hypothetical protein HN374_05875 [Cryomorphaceae bacterium]|nr:hypothetical protein [Cryomorphaceae bacterium]